MRNRFIVHSMVTGSRECGGPVVQSETESQFVQNRTDGTWLLGRWSDIVRPGLAASRYYSG